MCRRLVALADSVADHYPWLRRDLIVAGLVLHDIGKTEELNFTRGFRYSTRGQLIGHISMALEMVQAEDSPDPRISRRNSRTNSSTLFFPITASWSSAHPRNRCLPRPWW